MATESYNAAPTYPQDGTPVRRHGAGMATAALVLGILALLSSITIVGGIVFGLLALVFGFIGLRRTKVGAPGKGRAITGIITGVIGLIISVALVFAGFALWNSDTVQNLRSCLDNANGNAQQIQSCNDEFSNQVDNQVNNGN